MIEPVRITTEIQALPLEGVADDPLRLYCVMSLEALKLMNGARGKMMAQAGHAFCHSLWDAEAKFPEAAFAYRMSAHAYKIVLQVPTTAELFDILERHESICGTTLVKDAGFTVFEGPTVTCIGLGPVRKSELHSSVRELKVL